MESKGPVFASGDAVSFSSIWASVKEVRAPAIGSGLHWKLSIKPSVLCGSGLHRRGPSILVSSVSWALDQIGEFPESDRAVPSQHSLTPETGLVSTSVKPCSVPSWKMELSKVESTWLLTHLKLLMSLSHLSTETTVGSYKNKMFDPVPIKCIIL